MGPLGSWVLCWLSSISVEVFRECLNSGILPQECISVWDSRIYMEGAVTAAGNAPKEAPEPWHCRFHCSLGRKGAGQE